MPTTMCACSLVLGLLVGCPATDEKADSDPARDCETRLDAVSIYTDADGDGYGAGEAIGTTCAPGAEDVTNADDCDDSDPLVHPEADEDPCIEGPDRDCDGALRRDDLDGDGADECEDCDDADPAVYPDAVDVCDDVDSDCDGTVDEDATALTWYADSDGDGYGDPTYSVAQCSQPEGWVRDDTDCDDNDDAVRPGAPETCEDSVDQDCDGADLSCGIWGARSLSEAELRFEGDAPVWDLGTAEFAGDVDGDGATDLLLGAHDATVTAPHSGAAYVVTDTRVGDHLIGAVAHATLTAVNTSDNAGGAVAAAGDINGDGYGDLWVGASDAVTAAGSAGVAYLHYGPVSGTSSLADADALLNGEDSGGRAGEAIANAGDVDGDGVDDVVVGAGTASGAGSTAGEVYLVLGPPSTMGLYDAELRLLPTEPRGQLGNSVDRLGDTDGDGLSDVVVGWPLKDTVVANEGAVVVLVDPIGNAPVTTDDALLIYGQTEGEGVSAHVARAGDINGDGYADLLTGGSGGVSSTDGSGAAYVVLAPFADGTTVADAESRLLGTVAAEFACMIEGDGDLDGDGNLDLAIGAYYQGRSSELNGTVYVVYGPPDAGTTLLSEADATLTGETPGSYAGAWLSIDGDLNADGYSDLLVGAPYTDGAADQAGAVYLLYGGPPDA